MGSNGAETPIAELLSLRGRVAVVTGGASGIGYAICSRLAEAGASVVVGDVREGEGRRAAATLAGKGVADARGVDVTDRASVAALADHAVERFGGLDIWVNNAGIYPYAELADLQDDEWDDVMAINLRGAFFGASEASRRMLGRPAGVVLNVASTAGFRGRRGNAHYAASKHGVVGLTKSLAAELGPHGIRVLGVAPTFVTTPGTGDLEARGFVDEIRRTLVLDRLAEPDDVARVALFCVSDLAAYVTGTTVLVDGGSLGCG